MKDLEELLAKKEKMSKGFNDLFMRGFLKVSDDNGEILAVDDWQEHAQLKETIDKNKDSASKAA